MKYKIRCIAKQGMLPREIALSVQGIGSTYETWTSKRDVELKEGDLENGVTGFVSVLVIDRSDSKALIELPGNVVMGSRRVWIPTSELAAEAQSVGALRTRAIVALESRRWTTARDLLESLAFDSTNTEPVPFPPLPKNEFGTLIADRIKAANLTARRNRARRAVG